MSSNPKTLAELDRAAYERDMIEAYPFEDGPMTGEELIALAASREIVEYRSAGTGSRIQLRPRVGRSGLEHRCIRDDGRLFAREDGTIDENWYPVSGDHYLEIPHGAYLAAMAQRDDADGESARRQLAELAGEAKTGPVPVAAPAPKVETFHALYSIGPDLEFF